uniref:Cytokine receptor family member B16 n=1 Tax=Fundulus heteroclitus TaxID=8078 RepID=A0A147AKM0_FUNHE
MKTLLVAVYLLLQLRAAPASLPAPVKLRVSSLNLHHVLHWEPGPGSPPGTQFIIYKWVEGKKRKPLPRNTTLTSFTLKLDTLKVYHLAVQASYNHTLSPRSGSITFDPLTSTVIGPPLLSLVGCGTYIQVNVSLPEEIQETYQPTFSVLWRMGKDGKSHELISGEMSFNLTNLERGVEYCVQVDTKTRTNMNTRPSVWNCTFTSIPEPENGMVVLVFVTALLIFLLIVLTMALISLYYTGFLCKLKEMPTALVVAQWPDHVFMPNSTAVDPLTIFSHTEKQRSCPVAAPPSARRVSSFSDEDCYEKEEDDAAKLYVNRNAELSSDRGSHQDSADGSGSLGEDGAKDSGCFMKKPPAEEEEEEEEEERRAVSDCYEAKAESVQVSFLRDPDLSGLQVGAAAQEEETSSETQDFSGDVNLFSVTLASMAACDEGDTEEEQDSGNSSTDFLSIYSLKPVSQTDSQSELRHPSEESLTECGYGRRRADSWMNEAEGAGGVSGYLTNR